MIQKHRGVGRFESGPYILASDGRPVTTGLAGFDVPLGCRHARSGRLAAASPESRKATWEVPRFAREEFGGVSRFDRLNQRRRPDCLNRSVQREG